jgi:hypothetical protein
MVRLAVLCLAACGCSDSNETTVSGTVSVNGTPAKTGSISFIPADGQSRTSGGPITDGKYETRAPIGNQRVEVRVPKVVGQRKLYNTPDSPTQDILEEVLPPKYNSQSELQLDVKPGDNHKDYQLTTK